MNETCDGADQQSARCTASTGVASSTYADTAPAGYGRPCPRMAGPSGP